MSTPSSNPSSYASSEDLTKSYDVQFLGGLIADDEHQADEAEILDSPIVQEALDAASGELEAACLVAKRYTPEDLAGLEGVSAKFLIHLVCDLAVWNLIKRRAPNEQFTESVKEAKETLKRLRLGELIFGQVETQDAGNPATADLATEQLALRIPRTTTNAGRFFGGREWTHRP